MHHPTSSSVRPFRPRHKRYSLAKPQVKIPAVPAALLAALAADPADRTAAIALAKWLDANPLYAPRTFEPDRVPTAFAPQLARLLGAGDPCDPPADEDYVPCGAITSGGCTLFGLPGFALVGGTPEGQERAVRRAVRRAGPGLPAVRLTLPRPAAVWFDPTGLSRRGRVQFFTVGSREAL